MTEARKKLDDAIRELIDDYEARDVEPEPPVRKIDHLRYSRWHLDKDKGVVVNSGDWPINGTTNSANDRMRVDLIVVAPDMMRDVIALVNAWGANTFTNTDWLREQVSRLRQRVKDGGFECDLE